AQRVPGRDKHAGARESCRDLGARQRGMRGPYEGGLAVSDLEAEVAEPRGQARALLANRAHMPFNQLRAAVQRLEGARLGDLRDAEVGRKLGKQLTRAWATDRVADTQTGETPSLGEAAEHEQARMVLQ